MRDLSIINWSAVARKIEIRRGVPMSQVYAHMLISGSLFNEKRLRQIADVVHVSYGELINWIRRTKGERASAMQRAHSAKHSFLNKRPQRSANRRGADARSNLQKSHS